MRRVVITGMGCVTPLGHSVEELWANLMACKSGVGPTTLFDASSFPTRIAAEVKDWSIASVGEDEAEWAKRGRHTRFAAGAAKQAMEQSGVAGTVEPTRMGVYLGAGEGQQDFDSFSRMMTLAMEGGELDVARFVEEGVNAYNQAVAGEHTIKDESGAPYIFTSAKFQPTSLIDLSTEDNRTWLKNKYREGLDLGADGYMADFAEWLPVDAV